MTKKTLRRLTSLLLVGMFLFLLCGCNKHECAFVNLVVNEKYLCEETTCTQKAKYYYSCECGNKGEECFEYGDVLQHSYTNEKATAEYLYSLATCTQKSKYYYSCDCGKKGEECFEYGDFLEHDFENEEVSDEYFCSSATCMHGVRYYYFCDCGEIGDKYFEYGDALEHSYLNYTYNNGTKTAKCEYGCGTEDVKEVDITEMRENFTYENTGLPVIYFNGDVSEMTKENEVVVGVKYYDEKQEIECDAEIKWQGSSSLAYPKKNYTIKLLKKGEDKKYKAEIKEEWGKQNKYCLKANYIDFSHSRNVVSGILYNEVIKSRNLSNDVGLINNGGVVDGFPVIIYINDSYQGLYTLNIPKDKWMFGMSDDEEGDSTVTKQAAIMGDSWSDAVYLRENVEDFEDSGFDLEYYSTEDTVGDDWVYDSFNRMITFVNENDGKAFRDGIGNYVNIDRTIDSMIYTWFINANDNRAKNIMWLTYDGEHWFSSMYDMDGTWGIKYEGSKYYQETANFWNEGQHVNELWRKLWVNYKEEITNRYKELREDVLSEENIISKFTSFTNKIPDIVRLAEKSRWEGIPSFNHSDIDDIKSFLEHSAQILDAYFKIS